MTPVDPRHTPEAETFRKHIRRLLEDRLPPDWQGIGAMRISVSNWAKLDSGVQATGSR